MVLVFWTKNSFHFKPNYLQNLLTLQIVENTLFLPNTYRFYISGINFVLFQVRPETVE